MELRVQSDESEILGVAVRGRITLGAMPEDTSKPMTDILGSGAYNRAVLLDLSESDFIDSSGLSWLMVLTKRFREQGGKLIIHSVPVRVMQVLRVMSLDRVLKIVPDRAAAMAAARGEEP